MVRGWLGVVPQNDGVNSTESGVASSKHHRGTTMNYYAGIDVSLEASCICVVDANGKVVREGKVSSEPAAMIAWLSEVGVTFTRIGLEAGPLSQWLYAAMRQEGGQDDPGGVRGAYQGACYRTSKSGGHCIRAAFGARGAPASVQ